MKPTKPQTQKLSRDDLAVLPPEIRRELERDGAEAETVRPRADSRPTPAPKPGQRDETLVDVLCIMHNMPVGVVAEQDEDHPDNPDAVKLVERRLERKERVRMPRWCAELMADKDQVVIL